MTTRTGVLGVVVLLLILTLLWPCSATAAILTVTSCADIGPLSLRGRVAAASGGDTILLPACTITLASPVTIAVSLTLSGEGAARTAVSGGGVTQVLVVNDGTVVTISGVTIRDGMGGFGAGIFNSGTLTLLNSAVSQNRASGAVRNSGTLTLLNSTVSGNTSSLDYGGFFNFGTLTLLNSTVSGNTASGSAGGIYNVNVGTVTLLNTTVSGNTAGAGGGVYNNGGVVALKNTIVANNSAAMGGDCFGAVTSQGHNLDSDGSCSLAAFVGDLSGVDPKLGPLQDNGGPTPTQALLPGSPAIDAGDVVGCPPTDQRGIARPQDGDGTGSAACDIGAYEAAPPPSPLTISPASGLLVSTEGFDLVLTLNAPGRVVVGGQATFDGIDIGAALAPCLRPGTLLAGGQTFRCPGLTGALLPPGVHTFTLTLDFNTGPAATDTATWTIKPNTEP
jgi:parallel beta-helix repeat protein